MEARYFLVFFRDGNNFAISAKSELGFEDGVSEWTSADWIASDDQKVRVNLEGASGVVIQACADREGLVEAKKRAVFLRVEKLWKLKKIMEYFSRFHDSTRRQVFAAVSNIMANTNYSILHST
jgi:hypothetical protein